MGAEAYVLEEERSENISEARRISERVFGKFKRSTLGFFFLGKSRRGHSIPKETVEILRERFTVIGVHLVEAARFSPLTGCEGDYRCAEKSFSGFSIHDALHAVVSWSRRKDPIPLFLQVESQVNSEELIKDELYATLGHGNFGSYLMREDLTKEQAFYFFMGANQIGLGRIVMDEFYKENPDASDQDGYAVGKEFLETFERVMGSLDPEFFRLMHAVYDAAHASPPRYDVMLNWFLENSKDFPEYQQR